MTSLTGEHDDNDDENEGSNTTTTTTIRTRTTAHTDGTSREGARIQVKRIHAMKFKFAMRA